MVKPLETLHKDVILSSAGVTVTLVLADPTIFLSGFSKQEQAERPPALVRGSLIVRIAKAIKIKAINLNFKGISRTDWPEGIPSDKSETHETKEVFSHEWRLFSSQFPNAEKSSGAHSVFALDAEQKPANSEFEALQPAVTSSTPHELVNQHEAVNKGYRVFNPAEYVYNFELILPQKLPETLKCNFGQIRWGFTLTIERYGTFKPNLTAHKEVTLLRSLGPSNLEGSEPIVISRDWEDLLHYEIIIAGKAFTIGQKFNVAFALVPLAKVKCHRIRVYITEHTEYFCRNHRIHRVEPSHKFLLMEYKSPDGNRGDLLKSAGQGLSGLTEFEFKVEIPESFPSRRDYLRPNANTEYIKVYHWVKAVMRLSRHDMLHNGEPKCYEVSVDSPITLVDPRTSRANELPDYDTAKRKNSMIDALRPYQEFIQKESTAAAVRSGNTPVSDSLIYDSTMGHSRESSDSSGNRAIYFARQPSIAPPPFDADIQPPQLLPPQYDINKEDVLQYERRYEEYLISTGRLPPRLPVDGLNASLTADNASDSNASDSNASTLSQTSDNGSGSTAITVADGSSVENPTEPRKPPFSDNTGAEVPRTNPNTSEVSELFKKSPGPKQPGREKPKMPISRRQDQQIPVFSEITWSEDAVDGPQDVMVDPRNAAVTSTEEVDSTPGLLQDGTSETSPLDMPPLVSTGSPTSAPVDTPVSPKESLDRDPVQIPPALESPTLQRPHTSEGANNEITSSPRPIPKRASLSTTRNATFSPPMSYNQKLRSNLTSSVGSGSGMPGSAGAGFGGTPVHSRRTSGGPGTRLSLKTGTPISVSAGSPLTSPWSASESNAAQLFGDRWMDRSDSTSSFTSTPPRYFRQSSVVSMDVTRQAVGEAASHKESWGSRRPSRVGEIQEVRDWHPLSRRGSEASSVAISIAEYQGLHSDRQSNAPLLGDEESEMDLGLEWEHDFEDFDTDDRRSVVSAFYTVLTP